MLGTVLLVFLAACGVVLLAWCLFGLLLEPVFGREMVTLYFVRGNGADLERRVRAYGWLRDGRITGGRMVLVDCGLTKNGLDAAELLRERFTWLDYCPAPALMDYLELMEFDVFH